MNKYQEALDYLKSHAYEIVEDENCDGDMIYEYEPVYDTADFINPLQELVEKATPKKIQFNDRQQPYMRKHYGKKRRYDGVCPSCHKSIYPGYVYCPKCGQCLDWMDEDE